MKPTTLAYAQRISDLFRDAAMAGEKAPTNLALAIKLDLQSGGFVSNLIKIAETLGMIAIDRGNCTRVVRAVDGSWRTAGEVNNDHWRDRPAHRIRSRNKNGTGKRAPKKGAAVVAAAKALPVHVPPAVKAPRPVFVMPAGISWQVDRRGCQWPLWGRERPTHVFCDAARDSARPYCAVHAKMAYQERHA